MWQAAKIFEMGTICHKYRTYGLWIDPLRTSAIIKQMDDLFSLHTFYFLQL